MNLSILCSSINHPVMANLQAWQLKMNEKHCVQLETSSKSLSGGDILFLISCSEVIPENVRKLYKKTLVVHASALPEGRGWSPHIWQIIEGSEFLTITLLEAEDKVDTGEIWGQETIDLNGDELFDEINELIFTAELRLMDYAVDNFLTVKPRKQSEEGGSYYGKRSPKDSEIDISKPLIDSFNKLRIADPQRFPAFFYYKGQKFLISINKDSS